jgi:hypothetical protein
MMNKVIDSSIYCPEVLDLKSSNVLPIFSCYNSYLGGILFSKGYSDIVDFLISRQFNFYYRSGKQNPHFHCSLFSFHQDLEVFDDIIICYKTHNNWDEMNSSLQKLINSNTPVIVELDQYYLPYHPAYKNKHMKHYSLLIGINKGYVLSDFEGNRYLTYDSFKNANIMSNYLIIELKLPDKKKCYSKDKIVCLIKRNIIYGLEIDELIVKKEFKMNPALENEKIILGINGIFKFSQEIIKSLMEIETEVRKKIIMDYTNNIYEIIIQRYWHITFWESSIKYFGKEENNIKKLVDNIKDLVHNWKIIKNLFHKTMVMEQWDILERISRRIGDIVLQEESILLFMKRIIS